MNRRLDIQKIMEDENKAIYSKYAENSFPFIFWKTQMDCMLLKCNLLIIFCFIDDWKCDQYQWRHYGRKTSPVIIKTYYVFLDNKGKEETEFKRYVYTTSDSKRVCIHYKGNDSVTTYSKPHVRTFPSTLRELEKIEALPSVAYKRKIASSTTYDHHFVQLPKNRKQIKNLQSSSQQRLQISHDALYNLHELSYDIDYVYKIVTYPDLIVVCVLKQMLTEVN